MKYLCEYVSERPTEDLDSIQFWIELSAMTSEPVDLSRIDLSDDTFRGLDLSYADLSYADLTCADLSHANLSYANLSHANLNYANLSSADLSYANLSHAVLSYADLSYAVLSHAVLSYADLQSARLTSSNLENTTLKGVVLSQVDLRLTDIPKHLAVLNLPLWTVVCIEDDIHIGCKVYNRGEWEGFTVDEISEMDPEAHAWWNTYKEVVIALSKSVSNIDEKT